MFRLLWIATVRIRCFLRHYMPTNVLLDALRTRRGLKWGVPAMLLALPYLLAANWCAAWVTDGGPGWANLLVILFTTTALKFAVNGPVTLLLLIRALTEQRERRTRGGKR